MNGIWVDTDFGFDDLWALLLLRHLRCPVAGVSLVAGNVPLAQVTANAIGARRAYGFDWPVWQGAARPLRGRPENAEGVLGHAGMRTRGALLPALPSGSIPTGALGALKDWLRSGAGNPREILALGPLTNIARLLQETPEASGGISRLVWMGGSAGAGNHTPMAEFNATADAEALAYVAGSGLRLDIVDLEFCRRVTFGQDDLPETDRLTNDLLGGYLDIALERGRDGMAIYDPLAAMAVAAPESIGFLPCSITVSTRADRSHGATRISTACASRTRIAARAHADLARACLQALRREALDGQGQ
ncbi:MAG: nucleoside hydrolase [Rhodobacter sp.]|nr:nucleoside hydrolase [Rhodobacter sp.]